jgi:hypothetical protein
MDVPDPRIFGRAAGFPNLHAQLDPAGRFERSFASGRFAGEPLPLARAGTSGCCPPGPVGGRAEAVRRCHPEYSLSPCSLVAVAQSVSLVLAQWAAAEYRRHNGRSIRIAHFMAQKRRFLLLWRPGWHGRGADSLTEAVCGRLPKPTPRVRSHE